MPRQVRVEYPRALYHWYWGSEAFRQKLLDLAAKRLGGFGNRNQRSSRQWHERTNFHGQFFETFEAFCSKPLCVSVSGPTIKTELATPDDYSHETARRRNSRQTDGLSNER